MAVVDSCPHCNSSLLIRYGSPSPLDGKRPFRCLGCGVELPPRRSRALCALAIVLGTVFGIPLLIAGVWMVWNWVYRYMLAPFVAAGACFTAAILGWRALHATTPIARDTTEYPNAAVSLTSQSVSTPDDMPAKPDWAEPLREFVAGVIGAAGEHLAGAGGSYTVSIAAELDKVGIRYAVKYLGAADVSALEKLSAEIDKLPTFGIPDTTVKLTLSFQVRG